MKVVSWRWICTSAMLLACGTSTTGDDAGIASDAGSCEPGSVEEVACGMCGMATRFCNTDRDWELGECNDAGECEPGTTDEAACGNCGSRTRRCTSECVWLEDERCTNEGVCAPGSVMRTGDGCGPMEDREVLCTDMCMFESLQDCETTACTAPGTSERVSCGLRCGMTTRTCGPDNVWVYGACLEGDCEPGSTGAVACGACGTQPATCSSACTWMPMGPCTGEGPCLPDATRATSSGCGDDEYRTQVCSDACDWNAPAGPCLELVTDGPAIVVPFGSDPDPLRLTLGYTAAIGLADIYFLFDLTGSMQAEIDSVRTAVNSEIGGRSCAFSSDPCDRTSDCATDRLCSAATSTCVESPAVDGCVLSLWSGAGHYHNTYSNRLSLQADAVATTTTLASFSVTMIAEEYLYRALLGLVVPTTTGTAGCAATAPDRVGCPGFRATARRIAFVFTDEDDDDSGTAMESGAALAAQGVTLIGIWTGAAASTSRGELVSVVRESDSFLADGTTPLVFDGAEAAAADAVQVALDSVLGASGVRVTLALVDDPTDSIDTAGFVDRIETNITSPGCTAATTEDSDGDGFHDAYVGAAVGARLCFDLLVARNDTVASTGSPRVARARIVSSADGAPLETQSISFIVP
jgi:hypothetical protein